MVPGRVAHADGPPSGNLSLSELEQESLRELVQVLSNLRPSLVQWYDRVDFPRTRNDMERSIAG
jgi:hypothetical protein